MREAGEEGYRTKTELKNMNSFKFVADGITAEVERQIGIYEGGGEVVQQTLHFDPQSGSIAPLRSKEEAHDYRYFPEPDLVAIEPPPELVERARAEIGELPGARIRRLEQEVDFDLAYGLVTSGRDELYARVPGDDRRAVANVLMNQLAAADVDPARVNGDELGKLDRRARDDPAPGVPRRARRRAPTPTSPRSATSARRRSRTPPSSTR